MAFKNYFAPVDMKSVFNRGELKSVIVSTAGDGVAQVDVLDGMLVSVKDTFIQDEVYTAAYTRAGGTAPQGLNVRNAAPAVAADLDLFIIDLPDVPTKTGNGGTIRDGVKTIGLISPAGVAIRARHLCKYDTFVVGSENCANPLTVGQYAIPAANGQFDASATAPAAGAVGFFVVDSYVQSQGVDGDTVNGSGITSYRLSVVANPEA